MPDNKKLTDAERALFRQAMQGTRKLPQADTFRPKGPTRQDSGKLQAKRASASIQRLQASATFSSEYQPILPDGIMKYTAPDASPYLAKQLRRGDFEPDLVVDLHGLTQHEAQRDLAAALAQCKTEHIECCNVVHGVGKGILRERVPGWLMQHPDVLAFHQAPLKWGGQGALLVMLKLDL